MPLANAQFISMGESVIKQISSPFMHAPCSGLRCLLLDPMADAELLRWVYQLAPEGAPQWASLFHNTVYAELAEHGPVIVLCDQAGEMADYASTLLDQSNAGCVLYLDSLRLWSEAVLHCQSLLTVTTDQQHQQLMRFYEPRWLEPLLTNLESQELNTFFGPFAGVAWRNELGWRYIACAEDWNGEVQKPGWLRLGALRQEQITQARLQIIATELVGDYRSVLDMPEPSVYVYQQLLAAQAEGVNQKAHFERWLRLALIHKGENWPTSTARAVLARTDLVMAGKLDELERLQG